MRDMGKVLSVTFLFIFCWQTVDAQYFGRNKPRYQRFDFEVLQTEHFEIYHYFNNPRYINHLAESSETWYEMHQRVLKDTIKMLNPIIFYKNHADFQQTNAISSTVSIGTGGVTEALKNRVIMPINESNFQTDHVLGHELVHAFQYNMIIRSQDSSLTLNNIRNIPLWMTEGLAEYMSLGSLDAHTAMWLRNSYKNDDLPTIKELTTTSKYFPYRYGQAFWSFVTGIWGDKIIRPLYLNVARFGYEEGIETTLGLTDEALSERWHNVIKTYYDQFLDTHTSPMIGRKMIGQEDGGRMNISPAISPNGQYIIFLSEKDLFTIDLFLADAQTGEILRKVASAQQTSHIDAFSFLESAGAWSPDSRKFAFVVFSQGRNKIIVNDVAKGDIIEEIEVKGVPAINNITWSPDGEKLAFTGLVNGQSDLYTYNLETKKVTQLMDDHYSDAQPSYLPDNRTIVFTSDRFADNPVHDHYDYGSYLISFIDTETREITVLDIFEGADNMNPVVSPDLSSIIFLSNRDGFRNMYRYELSTGEVYQMTNYFSGISGITMFAPAISIARDEDLITYVYFDNNTYTIYAAPIGNFLDRPVDPDNVDFRAAILPPFNPEKLSIVEKNLVNRAYIRDTLDVSTKAVEYRPKFKLDYIGSTGIGVSSNRFATGASGGVNTIFSDILGDNQLYISANVNGEIYDFGGQVAYLNRKSRVQWGVVLSHIPYRFGFYTGERNAAVVEDVFDLAPGQDSLTLDRVSMNIQRIFQDQATGFIFLPFSTTRRLEFESSIAWYSNRLDRINNYYFEGFRYPITDRENNLPTPSGYHLERVMAAYVGDNSFFGTTAPLKGERFRIEAEQMFGRLNIFSGLIDYRRYLFINPVSLAFRGVFSGRFNDNVQNSLLPPVFLGSPGLVRGYPTDQFFFGAPDDLSINQLVGNKILLGNVELRIPFTGPKELAFIRSGIIFSDINLFFDSGYAWEEIEFNDEEINGLGLDRKIISSTGISVRVNLFGALIVEPYYAVPLSRDDKSPVFGLQFLPGW